MTESASTPKLDLLRIQPTWQFGDEAFNRFIDDADNKLVGIEHVSSKLHWDLWKKETAYEVNDVIRWENMKSHQYARCVTAGTSSTTMPGNNVTGSVVTDGTVGWQICSLTEADAYNGTIKIWLSGQRYYRGDAVRYGTALYRCNVEHVATNWTADNLKWQEIYASIRMWDKTTYYFENDTVIYNNLIYQCITAHVSGNTFDATEEEKWILVADTGGAKEWQTAKVYQKDQLVTYNGTLYRAKDKHTSTTDFATDTAHWDIVYASLPSWGTEVYYPVKTVVYYNNKTYKCLTAHTSGNTTLYDDGANWQILDNTIEEWATNIYYYSGQFVLKENVLYKCNTNHKASNFTTDIAKWDLVYANIQTWTTDTYYKLNSLVLHEGKLYLCTTAHTSDVFNDEVANWKMVGGGNASIADWESDKIYEVDNIVLYNNTLYRCLSNHTSGENFDPAKWQPMCANLPTWTANAVYKAGQVVVKDGQLFICNTAHTSASSFDGSKFGYMGGIRTWSANTQYNVGEIVKYEDNLYYVTTAHNSGESFAFTNFSFLNVTRLIAWTANKQYPVGSIVLANGIVYYANESHKSSATFGADKSKWVALSGNIQSFVQNRYYPVGSTVVHNGKLYKAVLENDGRTDPALGYYWEEISNRGITPWQPRTNNLHVNNIGSLLHFERSVIFDEVFTNTWQIKLSAGLTTSDAKFGNSCYAAGNWFGRYIHNNTNIVEILGSNDIREVVATIEFWAKLETSLATIFELKALDVYSHLGTGDIRLPESFELNKWNHFAIVLNAGTTYRAFVNGEDCGEYQINHPEMPIMDIRLGRIDITDAYTWIDEFCVTQEVKYTEAFTPPEEPFVLGKYGYYEVDDYVSYNNKLYRCIVRNADQTFDSAKWELLYSGVDGIHEWVADTEYATGAFVIYNNQLYECITGNADSTWTGSKWKYINETPTWASSTYYPVNMLVIYNGCIYRCKTAHTSTTTFDAGKFDRLAGQIANITNWVAQKEYLVNDTVIYNSQLYHCKTAHTSTNSFDTTKWDLIDASISPWRAGVAYKVNQNVVYNGNIYRCNTAHTSSSGFGANIANWTILCSLKEWVSDTVYKTNELVLHSGDIYICKADHTSTANFNTDYATKWTLLGQNTYIKEWTSNTYYKQNEIVRVGEALYRCNTSHNSASAFTSDSGKFTPVEASIPVYTAGKTYTTGQIVLYEGNLFRCTKPVSNVDSEIDSEVWKPYIYNIPKFNEFARLPDYVRALLHFDKSVTHDEKGNSWASKGYDITTDHKRFGRASFHMINGWYPNFHSNASFASILGESDVVNTTFTVEMQIMTLNANVDYSFFISSLAGIHTDYTRWLYNQYDSALVIPLVSGEWHHFALTFEKPYTKVYIDGRFKKQFTVSEDALNQFNSGTFWIEPNENAYIDELRICKGIIYESDFEPPTAPFPGTVNDYHVGDIIIYDNKFYRCTQNTTSSVFSLDNWELIGGGLEPTSFATDTDIDNLFL